jgi:precorrin-6B methylase 2
MGYLAPEPLKDVWRFVPPGSTVLEMGARYGTVSCAISRRQHNSGLRVSLEPSPSAYQILYRNTRANGCEGLNIHGVVSGALLNMARASLFLAYFLEISVIHTPFVTTDQT